MKAMYTNNDGDVCIIRPLVYTREAATKKFAYEARLPVSSHCHHHIVTKGNNVNDGPSTNNLIFLCIHQVINENCPACFEEPKERHRVKKMLAKEESLCPTVYANMRRALVVKLNQKLSFSVSVFFYMESLLAVAVHVRWHLWHYAVHDGVADCPTSRQAPERLAGPTTACLREQAEATTDPSRTGSRSWQ